MNRHLPQSGARTGTQSIERAFALMKQVSAANAGGVNVPMLAEKMHLNRTTVYRLLTCLVAQGALRHDAKARRYFLGPLALELGTAARHQLDFRELLAPALTRIAEATGDTVFLLVRDGSDSVCIDRRLGSFPIKTLVVEVGTRRPLGIGAGGLAMLSALSDHDLQRIIHGNASRFAAFGATARSMLKAARAAKQSGYVSADVQGVAGVTAIALPVIDVHGSPVAALAVAAIAQRMTRARQAELVKIVRAEINRLGELHFDANIS
jgi:DNA-binding IclR family transcriptional regulator